MSYLERPKQTDCRHEPNYPLHRTVVFATLAPDLTSHSATRRCPLEGPHQIDICGEFYPGETLAGALDDYEWAWRNLILTIANEPPFKQILAWLAKLY